MSEPYERRVKFTFNGTEYDLGYEESWDLQAAIRKARAAFAAKCTTCRCMLAPDTQCSCCHGITIEPDEIG